MNIASANHSKSGKRLKIGIFHLGFFYAGGGERLVLEEGIGLQKKGHQVEIFAPVVDGRCFPEFQKTVSVKQMLPDLPKWIYNRETSAIFITCILFPLIASKYKDFDIFLGANQPGLWFCWWLKKLFKEPYILLTNRHFPQKKFEYALEVLKKLDLADLNLVITGAQNRYTRALKKLAKDLNIEKRVIFTGLVSEKDLKKLYSHAAVYVYTAPEEDFGMGIIEAMGYGTPVVAWRTGGPTGIIKNGETGYLARKNDLAQYTSYVSNLLGDRRLNRKISLAASEAAFREFSFAKHNDILEREFLRLTR